MCKMFVMFGLRRPFVGYGYGFSRYIGQSKKNRPASPCHFRFKYKQTHSTLHNPRGFHQRRNIFCKCGKKLKFYSKNVTLKTFCGIDFVKNQAAEKKR